MSLHAVVYKKLDSVSEELRGLVRRVDFASGEIDFVTEELEARYSRDSLLAADAALGNISMILWLANSIEEICEGRCQRLLKTFLYNGSHAGEFVPLAEVIEIKKELEVAGLVAPHVDKDVREFVRNLGILVSAAIEEGNPIVFT